MSDVRKKDILTFLDVTEKKYGYLTSLEIPCLWYPYGLLQENTRLFTMTGFCVARLTVNNVAYGNAITAKRTGANLF